MEFKELLQKRRKELGLTLEEIGKSVGVSRATVLRWENGTIANLRRDKISALSKILKVTPSYLMGWETTDSSAMDTDTIDLSKYDNIRPIKLKKFPMLGEIACGKPITCSEEYEVFVEANEDINADFCLTAKGDSMINARIFNGDIVFIKKQSMVDNGEIAAVIIDNDVTLKRVYKKSERLILRAENPLYDDFEYEKSELEKIHILGKAVAFQSLVR